MSSLALTMRSRLTSISRTGLPHLKSAPLTPDHIMQTGFAFWPSKTLLSAIELGLFTELTHGPEALERLRGRLGLHERSARDFLDTLVALGFLTRDGAIYGNTPETDLFLDRQKPSYIGGVLEMANHRLYQFWGHLTEALKFGMPQNEARHGQDLFGELYADPARLWGFLAAMTGISHAANMAIARQCDYTGADVIGWLREAGFREVRVEHLVGPDSMAIGVK